MPFVVACAACGKRLNIPDPLYDGKIRGRVVTIACKGCNAEIKVDGTRPREEMDLSILEGRGAAPAPEAAQAPAAAAAPRAPAVAAAPTVPAVAPPAPTDTRAKVGAPPGPSPARDPGAAPEPTDRARGRDEEARPDGAAPAAAPAASAAAMTPRTGGTILGGAVPGGGRAAAPAGPRAGGTLLGGVTPGRDAGAPGGERERIVAPALQQRPLVAPGGTGIGRTGTGAGGPAPLPGIGGLPRPGTAARGGAGVRPTAGKPGDEPPSDPTASPPTATPETSAAAPKDFAKMTFPGTPLAMGRERGAPMPAPAARGFEPVAASTSALEGPPEGSARVGQVSDTMAEGAGRRRGVPPALRRTAPESPFSRGATSGDTPDLPAAPPQARPAPPPPAPEETAGAESDWLWVVSFSEDDDRELTFTEVKAAILAREVDAESIAWREGLPDWLPLGELEPFQGVFEQLRATSGPAEGTTGDSAANRPPSAAGTTEAPPAVAALMAQVTPSSAARAPGTADAPGEATEAPFAERGAGEGRPPVGPDSREDWRRSTADLLAEIAVGTQPATAVAAVPVAPEEESIPPLPRPPAAPKFSISPAVGPSRQLSRVIAYVVVTVLVLGAVAGLVALIVKGMSTGDDPTLRPSSPVAPGPSAASRPKPEPSSAEGAASVHAAAADSAPVDLAAAIQQNVDRSDGDVASTFDERVARAVLAEAAQRAALCRRPGDEKGPARAAVTFDPKTGRTMQVRLLGRYTGTQSGACIEATLRAIRVKAYAGAPVTLEQPVMLR